MAGRYDNIETKKISDGRVVMRPQIYPDIPLRDDDIYIITQTDDRIDLLAHEFLGDASLYWIILAANNIHDAVFAVPDGTKLRIPSDYTRVINSFKK